MIHNHKYTINTRCERGNLMVKNTKTVLQPLERQAATEDLLEDIGFYDADTAALNEFAAFIASGGEVTYENIKRLGGNANEN